jgi:phosphoribosylaminoimidazole-succinocarboxamide synthase
MQALTSFEVDGLDVFAKGKVRDVYDLGDKLLIVASDRISAFDHVLPTGIPDKGKILTGVSAFWFEKLKGVCPNHMISMDPSAFPASLEGFAGIFRHRSMLVHKARRIDIECIVRGFLAGSAWKEYEKSGRVAGIVLPAGLKRGAKLEMPIFTPSTKADDGHDINITVGKMESLVGGKLTQAIIEKSRNLFEEASRFAAERGVTIVDTKFEFGYLDEDLILIDEIFTPDSSRFWIEPGTGSESINVDKQFIRDFLESTGWDKDSEAPQLPEEVVTECRRRYLLLYEKLIGERPPWEA